MRLRNVILEKYISGTTKDTASVFKPSFALVIKVKKKKETVRFRTVSKIVRAYVHVLNFGFVFIISAPGWHQISERLNYEYQG